MALAFFNASAKEENAMSDNVSVGGVTGAK